MTQCESKVWRLPVNTDHLTHTTLHAAKPACADDTAWEVEVFFDGDCPLCRHEIAMLRRLDSRRQIRFTDIAAEDFNPQACGIPWDRLMSEIHGRLPDGSWITGVEVFRRLYAIVGCRWLIPVTRVPGIRHVLEWGYRMFARNRLKWTGRCTASESCRRSLHRSTVFTLRNRCRSASGNCISAFAAFPSC